VKVKWSCFAHALNRNGPVPTGASRKPRSVFSVKYLGGSMSTTVSPWSRGPKGLLVTILSVCESRISTRSTRAIRPPHGDLVAGFITRSMENLTDSAVNGSPLWKATFFRSLSSQVVSFTSRQDSASAGTIRPWSSTPTSFSYICA